MPVVGPNPPITLGDIDRAPDTVDPSSGHDLHGEYQKLLQRLGDVSNENEDLKDEIRELKRRNNTIEKLDEMIEPYARGAFTYMWVYSASVGVILLLDGFNRDGFDLPDAVLNILVGSTAVTVLGLVGMVLTGIFVGARRHH